MTRQWNDFELFPTLERLHLSKANMSNRAMRTVELHPNSFHGLRRSSGVKLAWILDIYIGESLNGLHINIIMKEYNRGSHIYHGPIEGLL